MTHYGNPCEYHQRHNDRGRSGEIKLLKKKNKWSSDACAHVCVCVCVSGHFRHQEDQGIVYQKISQLVTQQSEYRAVPKCKPILLSNRAGKMYLPVHSTSALPKLGFTDPRVAFLGIMD